jgi:hypothetical protein
MRYPSVTASTLSPLQRALRPSGLGLPEALHRTACRGRGGAGGRGPGKTVRRSPSRRPPVRQALHGPGLPGTLGGEQEMSRQHLCSQGCEPLRFEDHHAQKLMTQQTSRTALWALPRFSTVAQPLTGYFEGGLPIFDFFCGRSNAFSPLARMALAFLNSFPAASLTRSLLGSAFFSARRSP